MHWYFKALCKCPGSLYLPTTCSRCSSRARVTVVRRHLVQGRRIVVLTGLPQQVRRGVPSVTSSRSSDHSTTNSHSEKPALPAPVRDMTAGRSHGCFSCYHTQCSIALVTSAWSTTGPESEAPAVTRGKMEHVANTATAL